MRTAREKVKIDTSNMTVILGGAYTDVYKNLLQKNGIGFNSTVETKDIYKKATTIDFVERGMMTDESTWEAFAEVYIHQGEYEEVILDEETVKDPSHYQLVKKNKQINK